jgi:hypothetical protein
MKKSLLLSIISLMATARGYAQFTEGTVLQPISVVARRFDESGQLIKEIPSSYSYSEDGKLTGYALPGHSLTSTYSYNNDLLMQEHIWHKGGWPVYGESFQYTYENNRVKTKSHLWSQMNESEYWVYDYNADGLIEKVEYKGEYEDDYHQHWLYEYEDEGRTKIDNYWTSWETQGMLLRKTTVFHYDAAFNLTSKLIENYSIEGELTLTKQTTYTYTENGKEESEMTQTLTDGEWVNSDIVRYVYDENDRVMEWKVGTWSDEMQDWSLIYRATYELNEEENTLTVSFYKKVGEDWVWDDYFYFHSQPVFFESYLKEQEHALRYYGYDDLFDTEHIGQFVFTLAEMNKPTYEDVVEKNGLLCGIYPNPGTNCVQIEAQTEGAVVRFYDLQGKLMKAKMFDFNTSIDADNWPSGIYLWEIWHDNQKEACGKWIKE